MTTKQISEHLHLRAGEWDDTLATGRTGYARLRWTALLIGLNALTTFAIVSLAGAIAGLGVFDGALGGGAPLSSGQILILAGVSPVLIAIAGGYGRRGASLGRLAAAALFGSWLSVIVAGASTASVNVLQVAVATAALPPVWALGRLAATRFQATERVVIVGSGRVVERLEELCRRHPERGFRVVGFVDEDPFEMETCEAECLGAIGELPAILEEHGVDRLIVGWSAAGDEQIMDIIRACDRHGVHVDTVPRMFDIIGTEPQVTSLGGVPLVGVRSARTSLAQRFAKRALDIAGSAALLILFAPVMLVCATVIAVFDGRPVFFRQERIGAGGIPFRIVKFRTMRNGAEGAGAGRVDAVANGDLSIDEAVERIKAESTSQVTKVGNFLRITSLDEIPQLWNVLRGDMSLVGPRPLRDFEVDALGDWQLRRQDVRPGITGLWQVLGRSDISWGERMQLDYTYARHWSMKTDIGILFRTVSAVIGRRGSV